MNASDLETLHSLIESLETGGAPSSSSATRLLRTFKPLYTAACRYIEVKSRATPTANVVSFEEFYHEMVPTTGPMQWESFSALTSLDQFAFQTYAPSTTGDPTSTDDTAFASTYNNSSPEARNEFSTDNRKLKSPLSGYSKEVTSMQAAQLSEWFVQSRHMVDLMQDHDE